ncbi:hypothetical protein [Kitasatospora sp. DSM 101779]|uniref:hypothetical protein n=1 Tax=Kitasatospora sp. DSM 101779 TaxID=2853165 RepID=UPI0021DAD486|nr:hypothetical protein [Kitasatospora sp. DSM 101779]MCU7821229.1 hypothetical protein [Kitasatospora sp. DSM 101779]
MSKARTRITAGAVEERLDRLSRRTAEAAAPPPPAEHAYRQAAAVLACYNPATLRPVGHEPDDAALQALLAVSEPVYGADGSPEWRLPEALRRTTLAAMAGPDAYRRALDANPDRPQGPVQLALTRYLTGTAPPPAEQDLEELLATARVAEWLGGLVPGLPGAAEITDHLERRQLLEPLRRLVSTHFGGRADILAELAEHTAGTDRRPMLIWGPGGIGKSTVLARFILDGEHRGTSPRLPFAFIDLDRFGMLPQEPLTLLLDAVRQLRIQHPGLRPLAEFFTGKWIARASAPDLHTLAAAHADSAAAARGTPDHITASARLLTAPAEREELYREFARLLTLALPAGPVLLAIDTFETAQYQGPEVLAELWRMFDLLADANPAIRIVLSGRAPAELPARERRLPDFDRDAARAYLGALLGPAADPAGFDPVIDLVGGNPLSLRLAADLVRADGTAELTGIEGSATRDRITGEELHGYLYRRVLDHIEDRDVRNLARPALVLRRLTPAVLRYVLAGPSGVSVPDDLRAAELFDLFAREVSLLRVAADGALEHRSDVRRQLLPLLRAEAPEQVAEIHQAAVLHYVQEDDLTARAEELYHRLSLGETATELDRRWQPGVEALLTGSIDELPPGSQAYLASRSGRTLFAATLREVPAEEWERHAEVQVTRLLELDDPHGAAEVLGDRPAGSERGARLLLLEARVRAALGELDSARALASAARSRAAEEHDQGVQLEADFAHARWAVDEGFIEEAGRLLAEAAELAEGLGDRLMGIRVEVARWEIARLRTGSGAETDAFARRLARLVDDRAVELLSQDPRLLLAATGAVGELRPALVRQSLQVIGLRRFTSRQRTELARVLAEWDETLGGEAARTAASAGPGAVLPATGFWPKWLATATPAQAANALTALTAALPGGGAVLAALAAVYRQWLDKDGPAAE